MRRQRIIVSYRFKETHGIRRNTSARQRWPIDDIREIETELEVVVAVRAAFYYITILVNIFRL